MASPETNIKNRDTRIYPRIYLGVLGAGVIVEGFFYSRTQSITLDESTTLIGAHHHAVLQDIHTVAYNAFLSLWLTLSRFDLDYQKSFSWFSAAAAIISVYFFVKKTLGPSVAAITALLLTVSPTLVYYSQLGRSYAFNLLASILCSWAYLQLKKSRDRRSCGFYLLAAWLMVGSHIVSLIVIAMQWLHFLSSALLKRERRDVLFWLKLQAVFFLGFLPVLWIVVTRFHPFGSLAQYYTWVKMPGWNELGNSFTFFSGTLEYAVPDLWTKVLTAFFLILVFAGLSERLNYERSYLLLWLLGPMIFLFTYSHLLYPVFILRGLTTSLVPWSIFAAIGLSRISLRDF